MAHELQPDQAVARKIQTAGTMVRSARDSAAMKIQMPPLQFTGMRVPPRIRKIPILRRRLPVTMITDPPQTFNIRHSVKQFDTPVAESRLVQPQLA